MKIDVKTNNETKFSNLTGGDTFSYHDGIWMKLDHTVKGMLDNHRGNAVFLETGDITEFDDDDKITLVKTKLVNA